MTTGCSHGMAGRRLGLAAGAFLFFLGTAPATSAQAASAGLVCGARDDIVRKLDQAYGERRNNRMLDGQGNLVELFSNADSGSWTLTVTKPGGPTCVLSAGESFLEERRTAALGRPS